MPSMFGIDHVESFNRINAASLCKPEPLANIECGAASPGIMHLLPLPLIAILAWIGRRLEAKAGFSSPAAPLSPDRTMPEPIPAAGD